MFLPSQEGQQQTLAGASLSVELDHPGGFQMEVVPSTG